MSQDIRCHECGSLFAYADCRRMNRPVGYSRGSALGLLSGLFFLGGRRDTHYARVDVCHDCADAIISAVYRARWLKLGCGLVLLGSFVAAAWAILSQLPPPR